MTYNVFGGTLNPTVYFTPQILLTMHVFFPLPAAGLPSWTLHGLHAQRSCVSFFSCYPLVWYVCKR